ncbi:hypothetical protein QQP08_009461 [Theobroma cacao]|nr:hypothetical protein QQP08_009461 [Theobroma cacao]
MAITVACDLSIYAADLTWKYPFFNLSGFIELRIRSSYQLLIKTEEGLEFPIDDITNPERCNFFAIPTTFVFLEENELHVEKTLSSLVFDDSACKFLAPKMAEFAVEVAERRGAGEMEQGYATVAEVGIVKADYIEKEELARIATNLKGSDICSGPGGRHFDSNIVN